MAEIPAHVGTRQGLIDLPADRPRAPNSKRPSPEPPPMPPGPEPAPAGEGKRHEVLGLVTLSAGLMLSLALASYDAQGGADWCGPTGAAVAESLVALIGTASVAVAWSLLVLSVRLFRRTVRPIRPMHAAGTAAIIATLATALHLAFGDRAMLGHLAPGGLVGATLGELLRATIGDAGAHLVVLTALLIALVLRTRLSVVSFAVGARQAGLRSSRVARDGIVTVARAWQQARDGGVDEVGEGEEEPRIVAAEDRTAAVLAGVFAEAERAPFLDGEDDDAVDTGPVFAGAEATSGVRAATALVQAAEQGDGSDVRSVDAPLAWAADASEPSEPPAAPQETAAAPPAPKPRAPRRAPRKAATPAVPPADAPASADALATIAAPPPAEPTVQSASSASSASSVRAPVATASPVPEAEAPEVVPVRVTEPPAPRAARASTPPVAAKPLPAPADVEPEATPVEAAPAPAGKMQIVSHDEEIRAAMRAPSGAGVSEHAATPPAPASTRGAVVMEMPTADLLTRTPAGTVHFDEAQLRASADRLIKTLKDYSIDGRVVEIHPGPVVTTFEFVPAAGTKLSKIARLSDDIAMSLEAMTVRIVAPIPGKGRVGFEIPNVKRQTVYFREMIETEAFKSLGGALPVALGKDVVGAPFFADLATMPHLIVAGATGAGKSVGLNVMLTSLLYKRGPEDVRLLMIDPKMVELAVYDGIPHMLLPVVTDMKKASLALRWVVDEMERRYTLFAQTGARNITTYNERVAKAIAEGKPLKGMVGPVRPKDNGTTVEVGAEGTDGAPPAPDKPVKLPYILVVVDEFADLMMVAGKEVESAVARLAQKARAAGIHVILATQRPSVDVITGVIKANFPSRIAFKVSQKVDSRTILDQQGAEHLLGRGDMLVLPPGSSDLRRVHCAFVSEDEVQAVADHWRKQGTPTYDEEILRPRDEDEDGGGEEPEIKVPMDKYEKAVALVLSSRRCSVSWVQRQLAVGYNVAARMVEKMERDGIVGAPKGPGKDREVLG